MNIIVNVAKNWAIGKDNSLLFHLKQDMRFFRAHTVGGVVVMGRKTLESFPGGKPLKDRVNIVLTGNGDFSRGDAVICHSVGEVSEWLKEYDTDDVYIIGGESVYREFLPLCSVAYVTKVNAVCPDADAFMVNLDDDPDWEITDETAAAEENGVEFKFVTYKRV